MKVGDTLSFLSCRPRLEAGVDSTRSLLNKKGHLVERYLGLVYRETLPLPSDVDKTTKVNRADGPLTRVRDPESVTRPLSQYPGDVGRIPSLAPTQDERTPRVPEEGLGRCGSLTLEMGTLKGFDVTKSPKLFVFGPRDGVWVGLRSPGSGRQSNSLVLSLP